MVIDAEPEERRMSYLSDWCSSDTTAAEMHVCFCDFLNQSLWWILFFFFFVANEDDLFEILIAV